MQRCMRVLCKSEGHFTRAAIYSKQKLNINVHYLLAAVNDFSSISNERQRNLLGNDGKSKPFLSQSFIMTFFSPYSLAIPSLIML